MTIVCKVLIAYAQWSLDENGLALQNGTAGSGLLPITNFPKKNNIKRNKSK